MKINVLFKMNGASTQIWLSTKNKVESGKNKQETHTHTHTCVYVYYYNNKIIIKLKK